MPCKENNVLFVLAGLLRAFCHPRAKPSSLSRSSRTPAMCTWVSGRWGGIPGQRRTAIGAIAVRL